MVGIIAAENDIIGGYRRNGTGRWIDGNDTGSFRRKLAEMKTGSERHGIWKQNFF